MARRNSLKKQFSEDGGTTLAVRKKTLLRKQYSEEVVRFDDESVVDVGRPEIKEAWGEGTSANDSILAQRLRQAYKERGKSKQSLSIYLTRDDEDSLLENECSYTPRAKQPDILAPLQQPADLKSIFRKHLRDNNSRTAQRNEETAIVVVPIIERPSTAPQRPSTAASKREMFQNRTNLAFNTTQTQSRPPLLRSSSVPTPTPKESIVKPKFLATKRKVHKKRRDKLEDLDEGERKDNVVTMVSLVSPTASDNEEDVKNGEEEVERSKVNVEEREPQKKLTKSVSFQQTSIHSVRSFSATISSRRGSASSIIGNAAKKLGQRVQNVEDATGAKRRLLRTTSATNERSLKSEQLLNKENVQNEGPELSLEESTEQVKEEKEEEDPKEKECWTMYCKMNQRGLNVSYETILRGMLTPTEYRTRRKIIERREAEALLNSAAATTTVQN